MKEGEIITALTSARIKQDFRIMREEYPFSRMACVQHNLVCFEVWGYPASSIQKYSLTPSRIEKEHYSKRMLLVVGDKYVERGPLVLALAGWGNLQDIPDSDRHFYLPNKFCDINLCALVREYFKRGGHEICPCVPAAVADMKNPLLEHVRSIDHLMSAYELYLKGASYRVILHGYSHGEKGVQEYERERKRYHSS